MGVGKKLAGVLLSFFLFAVFVSGLYQGGRASTASCCCLERERLTKIASKHFTSSDPYPSLVFQETALTIINGDKERNSKGKEKRTNEGKIGRGEKKIREEKKEKKRKETEEKRVKKS